MSPTKTDWFEDWFIDAYGPDLAVKFFEQNPLEKSAYLFFAIQAQISTGHNFANDSTEMFKFACKLNRFHIWLEQQRELSDLGSARLA